MNLRSYLLFLPQSWKWKMGPSNISFLSFRVIFHWTMILGERVNLNRVAKYTSLKHGYCWWLKSCTTWDWQNPVNNGINYQSQLVSLPDFFHQQYLYPQTTSNSPRYRCAPRQRCSLSVGMQWSTSSQWKSSDPAFRKQQKRMCPA